MADDRIVFNVKDVAKYLGVHEGTVRRLAREGKIPAYRVGGLWRFNRRLLDRWSESQQGAPGNNVLAVDDDEDILALVRRTLEPEGFEVTAASTGAEAIDSARRNTPHLVLLDLKLPDMEGAAVLEEIRRSCGNVPVVIITGYPDSDLVARALEHSPLTLLAKPVSTSVLLRTVEQILGRRVR